MIYVFYADKLYGEYENDYPNGLPDGAFVWKRGYWSVVAHGFAMPILKENIEHTVSPATRTLLLLLT